MKLVKIVGIIMICCVITVMGSFVFTFGASVVQYMHRQNFSVVRAFQYTWMDFNDEWNKKFGKEEKQVVPMANKYVDVLPMGGA